MPFFFASAFISKTSLHSKTNTSCILGRVSSWKSGQALEHAAQESPFFKVRKRQVDVMLTDMV